MHEMHIIKQYIPTLSKEATRECLQEGLSV